jgi:prepilin-type N-terminal cleavage/methylation domain-containing protein
MYRNFKKYKQKLIFYGFTLIELLVVVSIIGLLASIVMVAMNYARVKARDSRRVSDFRQITTALALYYDRYGVYPCGDADLSTFTFDTSNSSGFLNGRTSFTGNCINLGNGSPSYGLFTSNIVSQAWYKDPLNIAGLSIYVYHVDRQRQYYILYVRLESPSQDGKEANDGGFCSNIYEVGNGVGIIAPQHLVHFAPEECVP